MVPSQDNANSIVHRLDNAIAKTKSDTTGHCQLCRPIKAHCQFDNAIMEFRRPSGATSCTHSLPSMKLPNLVLCYDVPLPYTIVLLQELHFISLHMSGWTLTGSEVRGHSLSKLSGGMHGYVRHYRTWSLKCNYTTYCRIWVIDTVVNLGFYAYLHVGN